MIRALTSESDCIFVHLGATNLKTTKAFTHGRIIFDMETRMATFGNLPAVAVPAGLKLGAGGVLNFQMIAPDGALRKQTRSGVLLANEKQPGILRIGGMAQTPRRFSTEDGWGNAIYKYRAFLTHPGLETSGELPAWLKASVERQKTFWNRLAWLCRNARRKCSPVPVEDIVEFVQTVILPEIDAFNDRLGRSKQKMKHPAKLKAEAPGLDGLWRFVGELRGRIEKERPVPEGLLEKVVEFAERYKADYTPLNEFINGLTGIAEKEAAELKLRRFEIRPTLSAFRAALDRRKTSQSPWSEGWPLIKYPDSPKADNWGLHYYLNKAGVKSALLEAGEGISGLKFSPALVPRETGHARLIGTRSKRTLREAEISISGENREQWKFRFGVLQHRPLPPDSHLKEWKLLFQDGALWLCLVVELKRPLPAHSAQAAGLDVGWRRTDQGIRFGTLYEPVGGTMQELLIDLSRSPKDHVERAPFRIDMGPNRWEKRNMTRLLPEWKPGDALLNAVEARTALQMRRDYLKDTTKILLSKHLGENVPAWLEKAGRRGLIKLADELKQDARAQEILTTWRKQDDEVGELTSMYFACSTRRMEYGQAQVAHDVCRHLKEKGALRLIVENSFLAKAAQSQDNFDPVSLKRSQKYRQFAAVSRFVALLKNTAVKYGIQVDVLTAINTTRICQFCNHLNPSTEKENYQCGKCERLIEQDRNAAVNLSRFAADPELAEMALNAGK